jgi:hypothetical protein
MHSRTAPRSSVSSFRPRSSLLRLAAVLFCGVVAACKPSTPTESARDIVLVNAEPRCEKLGSVDGVGGNAEHAKADALEQASERGATHVRLEPAHPDLEDGMTIVVTCTMFKCLPPSEALPPDGYR